MTTQKKTPQQDRDEVLSQQRAHVKKEMDKLYTNRECIVQTKTECINTYLEKYMCYNVGEVPRFFYVQYNLHRDAQDYLIFESKTTFK